MRQSRVLPNGRNQSDLPDRIELYRFLSADGKGHGIDFSRAGEKGRLMIFRAVLSIAFVAVFLPHEPDVGLGRPSAGGIFSPKMSEWADANLSAAAQLCGNYQEACAGGLDLAGDLRSMILTNLDRVKAELKESDRARSAQGRNFGSSLAARISRFEN